MWWMVLSEGFASPCSDAVEVPSHRVEVDLLARTAVETWQIDVPAASCPDGVELPAALEGAVVAEDGKSVRRERSWSGPTSASLASWNAPADGISVVIRTAEAEDALQFFADDRAHTHASEAVTQVWWPKGVDDPRFVWTTWSDWKVAGATMAEGVVSALPGAEDIGGLGRSLNGAELEALVSRLDAEIAVEEGEALPWRAGRDLAEVVSNGVGTANERGAILLTMLRGAGFDAQPAWFATTDDATLPRTLPAPHLLGSPGIAVRQKNGSMVYIDPGTRAVRPPEVPARMRGGRVLAGGRHLVVPADTAAPRGEVRVDADLTIDPKGLVKVHARLTAAGAAEQALRSEVVGLPATEWPAVISEWMRHRDAGRNLVVDVKGLDGMEPFAVDIRFVESRRLDGFGLAMQGDVHDLVAPGLAMRLPPGIAIAERLRIEPPEGMRVLTAVRPDARRHPDVLLNRALAGEGRSFLLSSDWRVGTEADPKLLVQELTQPNLILVFPELDKQGKKAAKRLALPEADRLVIEALLLWRLEADAKAVKILEKLHKDLDVPALTGLLAKYVPPGDRRPWEALVQLAETDAERIAVIDGLVDIGDHRLGWQLATALTKSQDPKTRTEALVQVARLQGPQPDARSDPEGARAWLEPIKLLEFALKRAGAHESLVLTDLARAYIREGRAMDASDLLDRAMDAPDPRTRAFYAEFGGTTGVYGINALGLVRQALEEAPFDPDVHEACGRALAAIGRRREGVAEVLRAAELVGNDTARWISASEMAAEYGDLRAAVFAARRASDLAPDQLVPAVYLQRFAVLAGDEEQAAVALERAREEVFTAHSSLDELIASAPEHELAILRHRSAEVEASKTLLRRRAALHFERHMFEDAALDGSLLLDRHRDDAGAKYLAAGVLTRIHHTDPLHLLVSHTRSAEVREARMDAQLVIGARPNVQGDRGRVVNDARRRPAKVAESDATWPVGMKDFERDAPAGFADNEVWSSIEGVLGWSDPARQMSVMRTERAVGNLPPPLSVLFKNGPTVLTTARGAAVVRLDGGALPVYAGVTTDNGQDVVGIGLSATAARDAVLYGIDALEPPELPE